MILKNYKVIQIVEALSILKIKTKNNSERKINWANSRLILNFCSAMARKDIDDSFIIEKVLRIKVQFTNQLQELGTHLYNEL